VSLATLLVAAGLAVTLLLIAAIAITPRQKLQRAALAVVLGVVAIAAVPPLSGRVLENLQWKGAPHARPFVKVVEDRSGIIAVTDNGIVFGHGMYDGRFNTDIVHDTNGIVRPYALSLFHPAPRDVLMIGLSSGSWAQVIANDPAVATLTVVEINSGYVKLIATEPEVASVLSNPKITIVTDDGRRWLRRHPDRHFDAIVSNTTWHFRASATNLLSVEFLDLVHRHLNPGGIVFYNTTESDRVQRTGCLAFAHGARFLNHMVLSDRPIAWDFQRWRRTLESYRIDGKPIVDPGRAGDRAKIDELVAWQESLAPAAALTLDRPIEPCGDLLARTAGMRRVTDDNMGTEWRYFLGLD
jgi:spermidine synthase